VGFFLRNVSGLNRLLFANPRRPLLFNPVCACLLLAVLSIACYAGTLGNGFAFDDRAVIGRDPSVPSLESLPHLLTAPYWTGDGRTNRLYRPLTSLSIALNTILGGARPWTYHLVNLLLHALVSITLYLLLVRLFGEGMLPLAAAALFCVHPLLSEAVASVVGRSELLAALFVLAALWVERKPARLGRGRGASISLLPPILYFMALLSKENALVYPAVSWLTDKVLGRPQGVSRGRRVWEISVLLGTASVYLLLRRQVLGALMEPGSIPEVDNPLARTSSGVRIATALTLVLRYLGLFLFPSSLSADYSSPQILPLGGIADPSAILSAAVLLGLGFLAVRCRERLPALTWGLGFTGCTFFLVSNLPFPIGTVFAERLFYLPSAGLCTVVGLLLSAAHTKRPRAAMVLLCAMVALLGVRTWDRCRDWKDDFTLFKTAARVSPRSAKVRYNLANAYRRQGDFPRAAENYRLCLELHPAFESARRNLAVTLTELGQAEEAVTLLRASLEKNPDNGSVYNNLGNAYRALGDLGSAQAAYLRALELEPDSGDPHNNLAALYQQQGDLDRAERELREALRLNPRSVPFLIHLGDHLLQRGRPSEALEVFSEAEKINPEAAAIRRGRGEALMQLGESDQARAELTRSLKLDPAQWEAPALLGFLSQRRGDSEGAEQYYLRSLLIRSDQPELRQNLGVIYMHRPDGREKALEQFRLCLALGPSDEIRKVVSEMVAELEKTPGER
jgi:protein O-mannosyl-transferase